MAEEATMTESQFDDLVTRVGSYLREQSMVELNRKGMFAMGVCVVGGFYAGTRAHIWWVKQKEAAKNLTKKSE